MRTSFSSQAWGNVTISDFIAHSLPNTNNDTITFGNGLFQNFADLQAHMSQDKSGTQLSRTVTEIPSR